MTKSDPKHTATQPSSFSNSLLFVIHADDTILDSKSIGYA